MEVAKITKTPLVHALLCNNQDLSQLNPHHEFLNCCQSGYASTVASILQRGLDPDLPLREGMSGLLLATANGQLQIVQLLLHHNAAPDRILSFSVGHMLCNMSCLHLACIKGKQEIALLLLNYGAAVNVGCCIRANNTQQKVFSCMDGMTPFLCAALFGYKDLCAILIDRGANPYTHTRVEGVGVKGSEPAQSVHSASASASIPSICLLSTPLPSTTSTPTLLIPPSTPTLLIPPSTSTSTHTSTHTSPPTRPIRFSSFQIYGKASSTPSTPSTHKSDLAHLLFSYGKRIALIQRRDDNWGRRKQFITTMIAARFQSKEERCTGMGGMGDCSYSIPIPPIPSTTRLQRRRMLHGKVFGNVGIYKAIVGYL